MPIEKDLYIILPGNVSKSSYQVGFFYSFMNEMAKTSKVKFNIKHVFASSSGAIIGFHVLTNTMKQVMKKYKSVTNFDQILVSHNPVNELFFKELIQIFNLFTKKGAYKEIRTSTIRKVLNSMTNSQLKNLYKKFHVNCININSGNYKVLCDFKTKEAVINGIKTTCSGFGLISPCRVGSDEYATGSIAEEFPANKCLKILEEDLKAGRTTKEKALVLMVDTSDFSDKDEYIPQFKLFPNFKPSSNILTLLVTLLSISRSSNVSCVYEVFETCLKKMEIPLRRFTLKKTKYKNNYDLRSSVRDAAIKEGEEDGKRFINSF